MNRGNVTNKIVIFLFVLIDLCSCMDDEFISTTSQVEGNLFALNIPEMNAVNIKTRSDDMKGIENVLAVVIRAGVAVSESPEQSTFVSKDGRVVITLNTLNVQPNETLHIFCNVGEQSLDEVVTDDALLKKVTCNSGKDVMYGVRLPNALSNEVDLKHSMSNVEVLIEKEYSIDSLLVCDVPKVGYAAGNGYITPGVEDITPSVEDISFSSSHFFVSRSDNRISAKTTFLLAKLKDKGWYRLDFYDGGKNLNSDINYKDRLLNIEPNTFYHFSIKSVRNDGYNTKVEARENPGSNIVYSLSVDKNTSVSNGQYALATDVNEVMLYPNIPGGSIDISAVFPDGPAGVTTYMVKMFSKHKHVSIGWDTQQGDSINLMKDEALTTGNSNRKISFSSTGAWVEDDFLEIRLGNITKIIRFKMLTANSYLMDCSTGKGINIPYLQANLETPPQSKARRIEKGDIVKVEIIWSDQAGCDLDLTPFDEKGWFTVQPSSISNFAGNVIVGAKDKDGTVLWSWHIWCMANDADKPIEFSDKGIFDYKVGSMQNYSGFIWMDRNLGAYDLRIGKASSRGLGYCHGRKDPFTLGPDELLFTPIPAGVTHTTFPENKMYSQADQEFTMLEPHPDFADVPCYKTFLAAAVSDQDLFEYTVKYPYSMPFIFGVNNWRLEAGDYWLTKDGGKSGYDPCPIGWRLPYLTDPLGPWYQFNYNNRVQNPLDPTEIYGVSWETEDPEVLAYYPYVPSRASLDNQKGNLITDTNISSPILGMVNKGLVMNYADESINGYHTGFRVYNQLDVNYPLQDRVVHWGVVEAHRAITTRCVRDKSIN